MDAGAGVLRRLAGFTATLRDNGFAVGLAEAGDAARILASPLAAKPMWLGQAFRALFCSDADEWRRFDEIFAADRLDRGIRRVTSCPARRLGRGRAPCGSLRGRARQRASRRPPMRRAIGVTMAATIPLIAAAGAKGRAAPRCWLVPTSATSPIRMRWPRRTRRRRGWPRCCALG